MCDIIAALPDSTLRGHTLFGKNSDRPAGECQVIYFSTGRMPQNRNNIKCSYLDIPDDKRSLDTMGCRPYWCWGYETGINERGVVGGNTAIFTRSRHLPENRRTPGLNGMELLRLGLERGHTAQDAVFNIVELLEKYGQYGSAVQGKDHIAGSYENAFILADCRELWILETSGRRWITRKITSGIYSLSNEPTIRTSWIKASTDLESHARRFGWLKDAEEFDFALAYGDHEHYSRQVSHLRCCRTKQLLEHHQGKIDEPKMMTILRDHYENTFLHGPQFSAYLPDFQTICMHDSPAGFTWGNTATSFIVELPRHYSQAPIIWLGYQPPCTSTYLALTFSDRNPDIVTSAGRAGLQVCDPSTASNDEFDSSSLWWRFYRLLARVREKPGQRLPQLRSHFDPLEKKYLEKVGKLILGNSERPVVEWESLSHAQIEEVLKAVENLERQWDLN